MSVFSPGNILIPEPFLSVKQNRILNTNTIFSRNPRSSSDNAIPSTLLRSRTRWLAPPDKRAKLSFKAAVNTSQAPLPQAMVVDIPCSFQPVALVRFYTRAQESHLKIWGRGCWHLFKNERSYGVGCGILTNDPGSVSQEIWILIQLWYLVSSSLYIHLSHEKQGSWTERGVCELEIKLKWIPASGPRRPEALVLPMEGSLPYPVLTPYYSVKDFWEHRGGQILHKHTKPPTVSYLHKGLWAGAPRCLKAVAPWDILGTATPFLHLLSGWMKLSSRLTHNRAKPKLPSETQNLARRCPSVGGFLFPPPPRRSQGQRRTEL